MKFTVVVEHMHSEEYEMLMLMLEKTTQDGLMSRDVR